MDALTVEHVEKAIHLIRGDRVMLDSDLAKIYGVTTKQLNQQVRRNWARFPDDFMFQLSENEEESLRSQFVTSKKGRGGRRYRPYVFTEHGVLMLAYVLNSPNAISASIQVVRVFIRLRQMLISNVELGRRLDELEKKYDQQFKIIFNAVRELMTPSEIPSRRIGIKTD